ncbi:hypothetical protein OMP38_13695 [Cohnella ginsengisoli]|uniref:Uncharacterized protein n=1 Tax=Cohnella ginsengisoli TaxID=425004 RepID=A0A9X4QMV6_9BACL|nr:hypothetical protein [Cohnella ginsengisoli]MDG0791796.1 hypothetical protein [Cohnella ginsengisoli]
MQEVPEQQYQFALLALRVIVPCFYVVSGFLVYQGWSHAAAPGAYVRKYVTRIAIIYAFFCLLFMIRFTFPALQTGGLGLSNLFLQTKILVYAVFFERSFPAALVHPAAIVRDSDQLLAMGTESIAYRHDRGRSGIRDMSVDIRVVERV